VLRKVARALRGRRLAGVIATEIRMGGERQGFEIASLDGASEVLAHVRIRSPYRVGRYGVDVAALDRIVAAGLAPGAEVYLVDEVGKMECLSPRFVAAVEALLASRTPMVATVAARGGGFIERVKRRRGVELWTVGRGNRDALPARIVEWVSAVSAPAPRGAAGRR
jgi:nucleoside-triphosphatase